MLLFTKVKEEIASRLAVEVKKSLLEEDLPNQAIYQLLGKTFLEKYLTDVLVPSLPVSAILQVHRLIITLPT